MVKPEELSLVVVLEMREGKAAELLCAGLRVAACVKVGSTWKMLVVVHSPGEPAIRKAMVTVIYFCPSKSNGQTVNIRRFLKRRPSNSQTLCTMHSAKLNETQQALWQRQV